MIPSNYTTDELLTLDHADPEWLPAFLKALEAEQRETFNLAQEVDGIHRDLELAEEQVEHGKQLVDAIITATYQEGRKHLLVKTIRALESDSSFER